MNKKTIYIIDEAQSSYADERLWTEGMNIHGGGRKDGPFFVLWMDQRSALEPLQFKSLGTDRFQNALPTQRLDLTVASLPFFTHSELAVFCEETTGPYGITISPDLVQYLLILTSGHPGLCNVLLAKILNLGVGSPHLMFGLR